MVVVLQGELLAVEEKNQYFFQQLKLFTLTDGTFKIFFVLAGFLDIQHYNHR